MEAGAPTSPLNAPEHVDIIVTTLFSGVGEEIKRFYFNFCIYTYNIKVQFACQHEFHRCSTFRELS